MLQGTLADVGADTTYTVTITRGNSYGSRTGSFTITATDVPPPQTNDTPWTKALDFSGSSERSQQVSTSSSWNALRMRGFANTVSANSTLNKTSSQSSACPWMTSIVFRADGHNSNQHVWNLGEGSGSNDDNIYLRLAADRKLYFGWGRGGANNECWISTLTSNKWYGVYVAHTGTRLSGVGASAANLAASFDIRVMQETDSFASVGFNQSTASKWLSTGNRMDRSITGDFTIGGRGSNRSFHGKVAAMTISTLRQNQNMPNDAEIKTFITDPVKWIADYREGSTYRMAGSATAGTWTGQSQFYHATGVQMWLMGNTSTDSYSNMIRNYVYPTDQNYTKLNMLSMVSNDIQSGIVIPGLT